MLSSGIYTCPIFGDSRKLPGDQLPSNEDVLMYCNYIREEKKSNCRFEPAFSEISKTVASDVEKLFSSVSIPVVSYKRIIQLITSLHQKYLKAKKLFGNKRNSTSTGEKKISDFKTAAKKLFDISSCKCSEVEKCNCSEEKKIPSSQREFLSDQRTTRSKRILLQSFSTIDEDVECLTRSISNLSGNTLSSFTSITGTNCSQKSTSSVESSPSNKSVVYEPSYRQKLKISTSSTHNQNRIEFKETALTSQRYNISNRATAALVTSSLIDVGLITKNETKLITDKNKIVREKRKTQTVLKKLAETCGNNEYQGIYFDGRKDNTVIQVKKGFKYYRQTVREEHISLVSEPKSKYVGHVTPISGQSSDIANSIYEFLLKEHPQSVGNINVIGCDGTAVNTGWKGGIIRRLEEKFNHPLQWVICLLHLNELPLRNMFQFLDGTTSGPNSYKGCIGKQLLECENLPVVKYKSIECDLPSVPISDLSKDQKYLLLISKAIKWGKCSDDLEHCNPGPLCHARWLTTANRILRVYISTEKPNTKLLKLVMFILKVYVPVWFLIKSKNTIGLGAKHFFEILKRSRYMPTVERKIVTDCLKRNAYFAFPENLFLSMLVDDRKEVRRFALEKIIEAREIAELPNEQREHSIRHFQLPDLQINANDYTEMIDWNQQKITPPPVLNNTSTDELRNILSSNDNEPKYVWEFENFPCHTQAVERTVKLVTEAASTVCGFEMRDGFIRSTLESRQKNPIFDCKKQYNV